jgi:hypothetical protein
MANSKAGTALKPLTVWLCFSLYKKHANQTRSFPPSSQGRQALCRLSKSFGVTDRNRCASCVPVGG